MIRKVVAVSVVVVLALLAGVALAAAQLASSEGTLVCVNNTNGLVRVDSTCRVGEYPMAIGGGSSVRVTGGLSSGVAWGATATAGTLPLTGVTLAWKCRLYTPPPGQGLEFAKPELHVTTSGSMTAFGGTGNLGGGTIGGNSISVLGSGIAGGTSSPVSYGSEPPAVVTSNEATSSIAWGAQVDATAKTCTFLWQAVEAPN